MNALDPSVTRERPTYRWHLFKNGDWRSCKTTVPFTVHPWTFGYTIAHASIVCLLTDSTDAWKISSVISSLRVTHASLIEITSYLPPFTQFPVVALPTSLVPTKHWKGGSSPAGISMHCLPCDTLACLWELMALRRLWEMHMCKSASSVSLYLFLLCEMACARFWLRPV